MYGVCSECGMPQSYGRPPGSKVEVEQCPFCALARGDVSQHKTEWFALHASQEPYGIIVEDLDPKGYAMRVLGVPRSHHACGEEPAVVRDAMLTWMREVAGAICAERDMELLYVDITEHSFKAHAHYQMCLNRRG